MTNSKRPSKGMPESPKKSSKMDQFKNKFLQYQAHTSLQPIHSINPTVLMAIIFLRQGWQSLPGFCGRNISQPSLGMHIQS
ncbi:MAG: hypothetical protein ABI045_01080 [Flavobacteriales bacterium]